ncbi:MAG: glycosyltransferase family 4 protein [Solirubrobacterales bacterium]
MSVGARPKLMFLVSEDWYFVSHRLSLARAAIAAGYEVVVACRVGTDRARIEAEGVRVIPIRLRRRLANPFDDLAALIQLIGIFRAERPDVVHQFALKPSLFGSIAAAVTGLPVVVTTLAGLGYIFINRSLKARVLRPVLVRAFRTLLNRRASHVIVQNQDDYAQFAGTLLEPERVSLIPGSGVDAERFAPTPEPEGVRVAVLVARMLWDKGVGEAVAAMRLLRARGVPLRLRLAGMPDLENPRTITEEQLRTWHAEGIVEWLGQVDDVAALWQGAHIAVLPSYREGLPKSLLEAAAAGRPMVATDAPGCRELVKDGHNGLLVPVKSVEPLADALARLAEDAQLRHRMGNAARQDIDSKFSDRIIIRRCLELYRTLRRQGPDGTPADVLA